MKIFSYVFGYGYVDYVVRFPSIVFFVSNVFWESLKLIKIFCEVKKILGAKTDLIVGFSGSKSIKKNFYQKFWDNF